MDERTLLLRLMRDEFGNLENVGRMKTVTVMSVDYANHLATVTYGSDPDDTTPPDPQAVAYLNGYNPTAGETAYLMNIEGHPVLIGTEEDEFWHSLTLPAGYTAVAGWTAPGYRLDTGQVIFRGACNIAASNVPATKFALPAGYRPGQSRAIAVPYSNGTSISGHLRFDLATNGDMTTLVTTPAATVFLMFEGVSFDIRTG